MVMGQLVIWWMARNYRSIRDRLAHSHRAGIKMRATFVAVLKKRSGKVLSAGLVVCWSRRT